jgi:hypothetical protein
VVGAETREPDPAQRLRAETYVTIEEGIESPVLLQLKWDPGEDVLVANNEWE